MDAARVTSGEGAAHTSTFEAQGGHMQQNGIEAPPAQTVSHDVRQAAAGHDQEQAAASGVGIGTSSSNQERQHPIRANDANTSATTVDESRRSGVAVASRDEEDRRTGGQASSSSNGSRASSHHAAEAASSTVRQTESANGSRLLFHRSSKEGGTDMASVSHARSGQRDLADSGVSSDGHAAAQPQGSHNGTDRSGDQHDKGLSSEQKNARDGQERSGEDEVAGALQGEADADRQPPEDTTEAKEAQLWSEPSVLQCLCDSPSISADAWGEKLKLPDDFGCISESEEDSLVMAACKPDSNMLSLFRAYAPHSILTFMRYARLWCSDK